MNAFLINPTLLRGKKWGVTLTFFLFLGLQAALAQFQVKGMVKDADGAALPGATILEKGTQNGTSSDIDGAYSLQVSGRNAVLQVSFIGYSAQEIAVNGRAEIDIVLEEDAGQLTEVVVTALGVEKKQRSLGYAVSEVQGKAFTEVRENNFGNALAGTVAGLNVSKPASGPAGSSRVIIRGINGLSGDNQPLFVVDGFPIDNSNLGSAGMWGGFDLGDGLSSINPDDIEKVSVLKGSAATALYGNRGRNGVILVTTKKASKNKALGVEVNSNSTFDDILVLFDDYQWEYGAGNNGQRPKTVLEAQDFGNSNWGEKLDGRPAMNPDGVERPYTAHQDNMQNFYQLGKTFTNTATITTGTDNSTVLFSMSNLLNSGIIPNSGYDRTSFNLRGTTKLGKAFELDAKINYVQEHGQNRPRLSDSPGNVNAGVARVATNIDVRDMAGPNGDGSLATDPFTEARWQGNVYQQNPYWAAYRFRNEDWKDRIIGFTSLKFNITEKLNLVARGGTDWYTMRQTNINEPYGTAYYSPGKMSENEWRVQERNLDLLLNYNNTFGDISLTAFAGANRRDNQTEFLGLNGDQFQVPSLETVSNTKSQTVSYGFNQRRTNSLFGSADIGYKDFLFLTVTARNDWFSTLPLNNNSKLYPSASLGFVLSDVIDLPEAISYLKLRGSWAQVAYDANPYSTLLTYSLQGAHQGNAFGTIAQGTIPNQTLEPTTKEETEFGLEARFWGGRMSLDAAVYNNRTFNQILSADVSNASGFWSRVINSGEIANKGVELEIRAIPVETSDLTWSVNLNWSRNRNEVVSLKEGQTSIQLDESRVRTAYIFAEVGQPYGVIKGFKYLRDAAGNIVHNSTSGLPMRESSASILGNSNADWISGLTNTIRYKKMTISALIDTRWGGQLFSGTNAFAYWSGNHINTLPGRENYSNFVGAGVNQNGERNTKAATVKDYYSQIGLNIAEPFIYDATYIKLRSFSIGFELPKQLVSKAGIRQATLSLVGRNLAILYKKVPNVDPESAINNGNAQGLELYGAPQTRNVGFNLNLKF